MKNFVYYFFFQINKILREKQTKNNLFTYFTLNINLTKFKKFQIENVRYSKQQSKHVSR